MRPALPAVGIMTMKKRGLRWKSFLLKKGRRSNPYNTEGYKEERKNTKKKLINQIWSIILVCFFVEGGHNVRFLRLIRCMGEKPVINIVLSTTDTLLIPVGT